MLAALVADFARVPGVEVVTLLPAHEIIQRPLLPARCVRTTDEEPAFRELAACSDYTLVIAPETDNLLLNRCGCVQDSGGRLLGSSPDAVQLTGDKLALGRWLLERGISTPECRPAERHWAEQPFPVVFKPRFGAGSVATFLIQSGKDWSKAVHCAEVEGWKGEMIVQPFVAGQPVSVAFLAGANEVLPLLPATQELSWDGRFRYSGGCLPLAAPLAERAIRSAARAVAAVPGLRGYIGIDVVLGNATDGSQDWVIEINPRLTTSYVGLRALAEGNLAESMLASVCGEPIQTLRWRQRSIRFWADGAVVDRPLSGS
jgi:predicted ATP-grasp superfamily ATP-dependent carboligase